MVNKEYLLDTNIVIKIWKQYPSLFQHIESHEGIDFKIYHYIAKELYVKEVKRFNGVPVLTDKFIKLLGHVINEDEIKITEISNPNVSIKYDSKKNIYYINSNKLSKNDYDLICICENYKQYTLVTEDKKIINSGKFILDSSRVLNFKEFLYDLEKFNVL